MARGWFARGAVAVLLASVAFLGLGCGSGLNPGIAQTAVPEATPSAVSSVAASAAPLPTAIAVPAPTTQPSTDTALSHTAVLIGDSQASGARGVKGSDTWVQRGLAARGYTVDFIGAGGTGYVARSTRAANYPDGLESGKVVLPRGHPALVVVQGGGNDANRGATDAQILANAGRLLHDLKARYPNAEFLIIGTLAKGGKDSGRRTEVDSLLAGFAKNRGIPFVSAGDWLGKYGTSHEMADGVHLTAAGHRSLAKVLAGKLKELNLQAPAATEPASGMR